MRLTKITYWIVYHLHGMIEFVLDEPNNKGCVIQKVQTEIPEEVNWLDLE